MAEEEVKEVNEINAATEEMELVGGENENEDVTIGESKAKRTREDDENAEKDDTDSKKQKVDEAEKSVEEERLEKKDNGSGPVSLGPKTFESSVEMFDYFFKFLHFWPPNLTVNKYEHMVLLELLRKGHSEPEKKMGQGIQAFQVRYHPTYKSRCFFLIREDETVDDFSFRKCVDNILPLPENMKVKSEANRALGGKSRGGGRGRGRGGKSRN